ncbi:MAG: DUF6088 family protein [Sedimentisphaeraceae bacterium JB056]
MQSIEKKVVSRIYGFGRGWAFSQNDFSEYGSRSSIDIALHRLNEKGTIRRVIRGIYDYPRFSKLLNKDLGPDIHQVAVALSRKFGWRIQANGHTALNVLGLSTQVPGVYVYLSDGPNRSYEISSTTLTFKKTVLKESGFKLRESSLIVQSLKQIGQDRITPEIIAHLKEWIDPNLKAKVLKDTHTVTAWIYEIIKQICLE